MNIVLTDECGIQMEAHCYQKASEPLKNMSRQATPPVTGLIALYSSGHGHTCKAQLQALGEGQVSMDDMACMMVSTSYIHIIYKYVHVYTYMYVYMYLKAYKN